MERRAAQNKLYVIIWYGTNNRLEEQKCQTMPEREVAVLAKLEVEAQLKIKIKEYVSLSFLPFLGWHLDLKPLPRTYHPYNNTSTLPTNNSVRASISSNGLESSVTMAHMMNPSLKLLRDRRRNTSRRLRIFRLRLVRQRRRSRGKLPTLKKLAKLMK